MKTVFVIYGWEWNDMPAYVIVITSTPSNIYAAIKNVIKSVSVYILFLSSFFFFFFGTIQVNRLNDGDKENRKFSHNIITAEPFWESKLIPWREKDTNKAFIYYQRE